MLYILHQVNCCNAFGAGFAGYLTKHYPKAKRDYHTYCDHNNNPLGQYCTTELDGFTIVHLFAQQNYGNSHKTGITYTNYEALEQAISDFRSNHPNDTAICPYNMGCGLAGGNWNIVSWILQSYDIIPSTKIDLINRTYRRVK